MVTCQEATNQKVYRTSYKAKLKAVCGSDIPKYEEPRPRKIPAEALIFMTLIYEGVYMGKSAQTQLTVHAVHGDRGAGGDAALQQLAA